MQWKMIRLIKMLRLRCPLVTCTLGAWWLRWTCRCASCTCTRATVHSTGTASMRSVYMLHAVQRTVLACCSVERFRATPMLQICTSQHKGTYIHVQVFKLEEELTHETWASVHAGVVQQVKLGGVSALVA
jgi:hypothetical protein